MEFILNYWYYFVIAIIVIAVIIFAFQLPKICQKSKLAKQGRAGETDVAAILKGFAFKNSYKVINDITIPLYDTCTQIDHILIGTFGLLVVETKSHKGDIYANPNDKEWIQIIGGKKERMYNPLMQNKTHVDALRYQLQKNKVYKVPIESIVVFSNAHKKNLYLEKGHPVIDLRSLKHYLNNNERFIQDKNVDVQQLYDFLKSIEVTDKKIIKEHNKYVSAKQNK